MRRTTLSMLAAAVVAAAIAAPASAAELKFASAGHPSPFLARRAIGSVEPLKVFDPRHGPALGLFDKSAYPSCRYPLTADDVILLFTDGLYEADNAAHEEYGHERLLAAAREHCQDDTEQLLDALLADVRAFSGAKEFEDDVCLVGVEIARVGA